MKKLLLSLLLVSLSCAVSAQAPMVPNGGGTNLLNPSVLTAPQTYSGGSNQPAGLDAQGGLIPATGLRTAAVTCSASCTTFGSGSNGVLFTLATWPYASVAVDVTSAGSSSTIIYEVSSDNPTNCSASSTWVSVLVYISSSANATGSTSSGAAGTYVSNAGAYAACFRARVSVYGSGTITAGAYQTNNAFTSKAAVVNGLATASTPAGAAQAVVTAQNPYPSAAAAITAVGTGSTGAVTATLAANASKNTYICGFDISVTGGTAAVGPVTISNLLGNTFTYQLFSTATGAQLQKTFTPCIPTTSTNTAIVITTTADGTASAVDVNAWGFQD